MRLLFLGDRTKTNYAQLVVQFYSRSVVSLFSHVVNLLTFSFTDFAIKRIASAIVCALFRNDYNHWWIRRGGGHPDSEIRGRRSQKKTFFDPSGPILV